MLSETQKNQLENYPKVNLTTSEFEELPEYSMSNPTQSGSIGVKKWKRRVPAVSNETDAIWFMGQIIGDIIEFNHIVILDKTT